MFEPNGSKHRLYQFQSSLDPVKKNIPNVMRNVAFYHGLGPRVGAKRMDEEACEHGLMQYTHTRAL